MRIKKGYLIFALMLILAIGAGIFVYSVNFKPEVASATVPNPGHTWAEMECNSSSLCINNNKLGIGTASPQQALDVNGKISMRSETTSADPSTTVVTKGYLSSYTAPTQKVLTGANPTCPTGTDVLMRCDTGSPCTWRDADYSIASWSKVMCGQKMAYNSSDVFLVYNNHTNTQCSATTYGGVAGVPVDTGGGVWICKFHTNACSNVPSPSGTAAWSQYANWCATQAVSGSINYCGSCTTLSHTFANTSPEYCMGAYMNASPYCTGGIYNGYCMNGYVGGAQGNLPHSMPSVQNCAVSLYYVDSTMTDIGCY